MSTIDEDFKREYDDFWGPYDRVYKKILDHKEITEEDMKSVHPELRSKLARNICMAKIGSDIPHALGTVYIPKRNRDVFYILHLCCIICPVFVSIMIMIYDPPIGVMFLMGSAILSIATEHWWRSKWEGKL